MKLDLGATTVDVTLKKFVVVGYIMFSFWLSLEVEGVVLDIVRQSSTIMAPPSLGFVVGAIALFICWQAGCIFYLASREFLRAIQE